jgi:diadenosine tetraphosphate (Ap4A) HIT family hydrolase
MPKPTTFEDLKAFILDRNRMRMTHVYKPVMLQAVLRRGGAATKHEIAGEIMARDELQIEHYRRNIVHQMPGSRLVRDGVLEQEGNQYRLAPPFHRLSESQRLELVAACERRIEEHRAAYGDSYQNRVADAVVGSVRYEAPKRSGGRCELCGASHEARPLHVDHIRPRAKGGNNDLGNLQVLCETCNTQKRDRDDTDFRAVRASFDHREAGCVFCEADPRIIDENELAFAIEDRFPVTPGHTLVIAKRHAADYFDLYRSERVAIDDLLQARRAALLESDSSINGFNVGVNCGVAAGQTVMHVHVHLIPRRIGDVEQPRGGVRGVIPSKQSYVYDRRDQGVGR